MFKPLFGLTLLLLLAACGEDSDPTRTNDFVPLTGITVISANPQLPAGFTNAFAATGDFSGDFSRDITTEVTWTSSDLGVLAFDNPDTGVGRGIAPGTVTVTASRTSGANGAGELVSGSMDFTISSATLSSITVDPADASVPNGRTQQFVATGTFSDGSSLPITADVAWSSGDVTVATVDAATGLAQTLKTGTAQITAGWPRDTQATTGTAQLTVADAVVEEVILDPPSPVIAATDNQQFEAIARYSNNVTEDVTSTASWESSDKEVATISNAGLATAIKVGTTQITATFSEVNSNPATLTVAVLEDIVVSAENDTTTIELSDPTPTLQLTATGKFAGGAEQDISTLVQWSSTNEDAAIVNASTGLVQGIEPGTTTIRASKEGKTGSLSITVR